MNKSIIITIVITTILILCVLTMYIARENKNTTQNKYSNIKDISVSGFEINDDIIISEEDAKKIVDIIVNLKYNQPLCSGIAKYTIKLNDEIAFYIKSDCREVSNNGKQSEISQEDLMTIENIIDKYKNI